MTDLARLIAELDAEHRPDPASGPGCRMCWPKDGSWPCVTRMIAEELRELSEPCATLAAQAEVERLRRYADEVHAKHMKALLTLAEARSFLDAWCAAAEDGEDLAPLRAQTLAWMEGS